MNINPEIFSKLADFLNYAYNWVNQNIFSFGTSQNFIANFFKALIQFTIAILGFVIDILQWLAAKI